MQPTGRLCSACLEVLHILTDYLTFPFAPFCRCFAFCPCSSKLCLLSCLPYCCVQSLIAASTVLYLLSHCGVGCWTRILWLAAYALSGVLSSAVLFAYGGNWFGGWRSGRSHSLEARRLDSSCFYASSDISRSHQFCCFECWGLALTVPAIVPLIPKLLA